MITSKASNKDLKWMRFCQAGAEIFSTCSKKQYMAIIVDESGSIDSTGYNGPPSGFTHCIDGGCPRAINNVPSGTPYDEGEGLCYAIHAEINCLIHSNVALRRGGTMYVNGMPCFGCAKTVINSGLRRLCFLEEDNRTDYETVMELLKGSDLFLVSIPNQSK